MESGSLKNLDYNYETSPKQNISSASAGFGTGNISSDYVFGSNISSRVINTNVSQGASTNLWNNSQDSCDSVFTTLAKAFKSTEDSKSAKNLEESAKEVVDDRCKDTLTLTEVDLYTGEEGENQVARQHCRAYVFDNEKQKWNSLGAVHFHLNDIPPDDGSTVSRSRIVVRLVSTRKLVINTLVWNNMPVALADSRNLRISAMTESCEGIKSYLFCFPSGDSASRIFDLLNKRKTGNSALVNSNPSNNDKKSFINQKHQLPNDAITIPPKIAKNGAIPQTHLFHPSVLSQNNLQKFQAPDKSSNKSCNVDQENKITENVFSDDNPKTTTKADDPNQSPELPESSTATSSIEFSDEKLPKENEDSSNLNNTIAFDASVMEEFKQIFSIRIKDKFISKIDKSIDISVYIQNAMNLVSKLQCHLCVFDHDQKEWKDRGSSHISLNDMNSASELGVVSKKCSQLVIDDYDEIDDPLYVPIDFDTDVSFTKDRYICLMAYSYSKNNKLPDVPNSSFNAFLFLMHSNDEAHSLFEALKARNVNVIDHENVLKSNLSKLEPKEKCTAE